MQTLAFWLLNTLGDCSGDPSGYCALPNFTPEAQTACKENKTNEVGDPWGFWYGECTSYVAYRMNCSNAASTTFKNGMFAGHSLGNAGNWATAWEAALAANLTTATVDGYPRVGDIAVWASGHVAMVEAVNLDGTVNVSEYNWTYTCAYGTRQSVIADKYIHYPNCNNRVSSNPLFGSSMAGPEGVRLVWTNSTRYADKVHLGRSVNGVPKEQYKVFPGGTSFFLDTEVAPGNVYRYWVTGKDANGGSSNKALSNDNAVIAAPTDLFVRFTEINGETKADLSWSGPKKVQQYPVEFVIERDAGWTGDWRWQHKTTQGVWTQYNVTGRPHYRVYGTANLGDRSPVASEPPRLHFPFVAWGDELKSSLAVVNEEQQAQTVTVHWHYSNGVSRPPEVIVLRAHERKVLSKPETEDKAYSVVIDGAPGQRLSGVLVMEKFGDRKARSFMAFEAVEQPNSKYIIPVVHYKNWGWNSFIYLHNPDSGVKISVSLTFPSVAACSYTWDLAPRGHHTVDVSLLKVPGYTTKCFPEPWNGTAQVAATYTSGGGKAPVAVSYGQHKWNAGGFKNSSVIGASLTAAAGREQRIFAPVIQNAFHWTAGIAAGAAVGVGGLNLTYRGSGGELCGRETKTLPNAFAPTAANTDKCKGLAAVIAFEPPTDGQVPLDQVQVQINQLRAHDHPYKPGIKSEDASGYPAMATAAKRLIVPYLETVSGEALSGIAVQNVSDTNEVSFWINYYQADGQLIAGSRTYKVAARGTKVLGSPASGALLPDQIPVEAASATIGAWFDLVAVVNVLHLKDCADCVMSYTATPRP